MRRIACFTLALLLPVLAAAQTASKPGEEVRAADARRNAAMVRGDMAALGTLYAKELTYTHSTGKLETREAFLATISTGKLDFVSINRTGDQVRIYGNMAVHTGRVDMKVKAQGEDLALALRFTSVWVKSEKGWQMVAWQSTRIS